MKKLIALLIAPFYLLLAHPTFAAGGLKSATSALETLKTWLFAFVGVAALIYLMYNMLMAFMEKKSWGDVGQALIYCCLAGGALVGGNWALSVFN